VRTPDVTWETYEPDPGEVVAVSNNIPEELGTFYVQRFVVKHNGVFYCERDDGKTDSLIGWKYCAKTLHKLVETRR